MLLDSDYFPAAHATQCLCSTHLVHGPQRSWQLPASSSTGATRAAALWLAHRQRQEHPWLGWLLQQELPVAGWGDVLQGRNVSIMGAGLAMVGACLTIMQSRQSSDSTIRRHHMGRCEAQG